MTIILLNITRELSRKNNIEENKTKNDLYRIYMDLDLVKAREMIDNLLNEYISRWILVNITSRGDDYIKDQEVDELINYVTSKFILEMSDVHLFYLKCLYNITDDNSLITFIREETKFLVLEFITDFNKIE
jgi:hypothetical protein